MPASKTAAASPPKREVVEAQRKGRNGDGQMDFGLQHKPTFARPTIHASPNSREPQVHLRFISKFILGFTSSPSPTTRVRGKQFPGFRLFHSAYPTVKDSFTLASTLHSQPAHKRVLRKAFPLSGGVRIQPRQSWARHRAGGADTLPA